MTELLWDGKYDKATGKKCAPPRIILPFQTVETINESAADRHRTLDMFASGKPAEWRNRLIWGDKKYVLPSLLPEFAGKVKSSRLDVRGNTLSQNGSAIRVLANAEDNRFTANRFIGNAFDVVTNSRSASSTFDRNWWDEYHGYDLDRDGIGDVPFRPVRLFALVVEQHPLALLLLRSPLVALLDAAERVIPVLTPDALVDRHPLMRSPR